MGSEEQDLDALLDDALAGFDGQAAGKGGGSGGGASGGGAPAPALAFDPMALGPSGKGKKKAKKTRALDASSAGGAALPPRLQEPVRIAHQREHYPGLDDKGPHAQ